jgi:hypothetical protein
MGPGIKTEAEQLCVLTAVIFNSGTLHIHTNYRSLPQDRQNSA